MNIPKFAVMYVLAILVCSTFNSEAGAKVISCEEPADDMTVVGNLTVQLTEKNEPTEITYVRKDAEIWSDDAGDYVMTKGFTVKFQPGDSTLSSQIVKNKIEYYEDDGTPVYNYNIENVQQITASKKNGDELKVMVNDHSYSGTPGSTFFLKVNGQEIPQAGQFFLCDGDTALSWGQ